MRFVAIVCVCLSVLDFGVELLVVYMICVNSGCLDPRMQLQLFFVFFFPFLPLWSFILSQLAVLPRRKALNFH